MTPTTDDRLDLEIHQGREPALAPADINVVIDVLRAFTTAHVALSSGCREVLLAETVDEAFALADEHPDHLLAGERDARKVEGFDVGNSPTLVSRLDLEGRGMILTTTNGVRALLNALEADHVLAAGWANVDATLAYVRAATASRSEVRIHLVASHPESDEDVACADYLAGRLRGAEPPRSEAVVDRIRRAQSAQKFYSTEFRTRDLDLACRRRSPGLAMPVDTDGETPRLRPREAPRPPRRDD